MYKVNQNHKQLTEQLSPAGLGVSWVDVDAMLIAITCIHCEDGKVLIAKDQSVTIHQETSMLLLYLLAYCPKPLFILSPKQQQIGKDSLSYLPPHQKKFSKLHEMPPMYQNMVCKNIGILFHDQIVWVNITGPAITARLNLPMEFPFFPHLSFQGEGKGCSYA